MGYLHYNREQFKEAIDLVVYKTGISPEIVEKDYYVTLILKLLAEKIPYIAFKGGTSLSKCHKVIKRFSEDIDISVNKPVSQGQKKKIKMAIVDAVSNIGLKIENLDATRSRRTYNKYIVPYDSVISTEDGISRTVIIESSYAALAFPVQIMMVDNYIGEMMKEEAPHLIETFGLEPFEMNVQKINRTLAEKVFAICDYYLRGEVHKYSRHLYDIYMLYPLVPQDDEFKSLVKEVRKIRKESDYCPSAKDGVDIPAILQEIVDKEIYKSDYKNVTEYLLDEVVPYEDAIGTIETIIKSNIFI